MIVRPFPGLGLGQLLGPPRPKPPALPAGSVLTHLARTAMTQALRALRIGPGNEVLLPAFHCGVEADAARHAGARVRFYPVGTSLEVDPAAIERRMGAATRAVVAIHYFGIPQELGGVAALCRDRGVALIEDCAHVFAGAPGSAGSWGSAAVYSLPKFLPVPDGGVLAIRDGWPSGTTGPTLRPPPRAALTRRTARLLLDHRDEGTGPLRESAGAAEAPRPARYDPASSVYDPSVAGAGASGWTRRILLRLDFEEIARIRRQNYDYLHRAVTGIGAVPLPARAAFEDGAPMVLPIRVARAAEVAERMRALGVGAYRLGAHLAFEPEDPDVEGAGELRDTMLGLPVHQNLTAAHLDAVAAALERSAA